MLQDNFGTLHLPTAEESMERTMDWLDFDANRITMALATVLVLVFLRELYKVYPAVRGCLTRARGNLEIEHSLSTARSRNVCARICVLPLLLMASRYELYSPGFLPPVEEAWERLFTLAGVLLTFLIARSAVHALVFRLVPPRLDSEAGKAVKKGLYNYFLHFVLVSAVSVGILYVFHADDTLTRTVLYAEMVVSLGIAWFRESQILSTACSGLPTFLYLCGLEFLPALALVLSGTAL